MKLLSIVGARPNFMKIAPLVHAVEGHNRDITVESQRITHCLVHTGQHYDAAMSAAFFNALNIPQPNIDLGIGSGTHAEQVGKTMMALEPVLLREKPDWVVVVGDVNATCAAAITAKKCHLRLAHIEAGLRSFDKRMPEEINRMVTDTLSDLLFTTDELANDNLRREGHSAGKIRLVGNIMIDTLESQRVKAQELTLASILERYGNTVPAWLNEPFGVVTLHRPSNVDAAEVLMPLVRVLSDEVATCLPLIWTVHPRTRERLKQCGVWASLQQHPRIALIDPVDYHAMLKLNMEARLMLTDSGGLQEECCVLGTPCITLRDNTERPVTLRENGGTCVLTGPDPDKMLRAVESFLSIPPASVSLRGSSSTHQQPIGKE